MCICRDAVIPHHISQGLDKKGRLLKIEKELLLLFNTTK